MKADTAAHKQLPAKAELLTSDLDSESSSKASSSPKSTLPRNNTKILLFNFIKNKGFS